MQRIGSGRWTQALTLCGSAGLPTRSARARQVRGSELRGALGLVAPHARPDAGPPPSDPEKAGESRGLHELEAGKRALSSLKALPGSESIHSGACIQTFEGHGDVVASARFSEDGSSVLTASEDHTAKLWSIESGACIQTFEGPAGS